MAHNPPQRRNLADKQTRQSLNGKLTHTPLEQRIANLFILETSFGAETANSACWELD